MDNFNRTGIYAIINKINGKIYIGSTGKSFKERYKMHLGLLKKNNHPNSYLQNSFNKYGALNFKFKIICICKDNILEKEQFYIDKYDAINKGYNMCPVAGSVLGIKRSEESVIKRVKITLDEALIIKNKLIEKTDELVKDKIQRISKEVNVKEKTVGLLREGEHFFSSKIGGSYYNWLNIEKEKIKRMPLTLIQAIDIKEKLLEKTNEFWVKKYQRLELELKISISTIRQIKEGNHYLSNELNGGYKDWIKETEMSK